MTTANVSPKTRRVTVGDLSNQIGTLEPRPLLYCSRCGSEISANKGDYFMASDSDVFRCCGRLMRLVFKRTIYVSASLLSENSQEVNSRLSWLPLFFHVIVLVDSFGHDNEIKGPLGELSQSVFL